MVASRRPRKQEKAPPKRRETLEELFDRVMSQPADAPFPKLTKAQAKYFLLRLWGSDPDGPPGDEVVKRFYGLWPEPQNPDEYPD
jgi:hypothetical protein